MGFNYILAIVFFVASCASITEKPQEAAANLTYRRDMVVTVNGKTAEGVLVAPRSKDYKLAVDSKTSIDLFTMQSCHREKLVTDIKQSGLFRKKSKVELTYVPAAGIEDSGGCPLFLGGYDKTAGLHSWAFIDFEDASETLPADLYCNGDFALGSGVSVCQARAGLSQKISFPTEVIYSPEKACDLGKISSKEFEFKIRPGVCVYYFLEKVKPNRGHRLTTIGYDDILIRDPAE